MEMTGERTIAADRGAVWTALNDPEVLKACIPGCQEIEKTSDTELTAKVVQKVGPVKATFTGEVTLSDIVEGESYTISGKGKGGAAGGASGGAKVTLEDVPEGTRLTYEAEAKVTGKIAQLGARLIDGFAKTMADQFFDKFAETVGGPVPAEPEAEVVEEEPTIGQQVDEAVENIKDAASEAMEKVESATRGAASSAAEKIKAAEPEKKGFWSRLFGG
ncbi:MAG: CoxG family protein [Paracoccaceae bacterium]